MFETPEATFAAFARMSVTPTDLIVKLRKTAPSYRVQFSNTLERQAGTLVGETLPGALFVAGTNDLFLSHLENGCSNHRVTA